MITGIDISFWNGVIHWPTAKAAGAEYAFVKASQAVSADPLFRSNWSAAKGIVLRGAYHYYDWSVPPIMQANRFLTTIAGDIGELPPVLDYEELADIPITTTALAYIRAWLDRVETVTGKVPMIYTSQGMWKAHGSPDPEWTRYPLWLADYTPPANVPAPWSRYTFWQYTSGAQGSDYGAPGGKMDLNQFDGSLQDLYNFAHYTPPGGETDMLKMRVLAGDGLNVRAGPDISAPKLRTMPLGTRVDVSYIQPDAGRNLWVQIGAGEWCALEYANTIYLAMA